MCVWDDCPVGTPNCVQVDFIILSTLCNAPILTAKPELDATTTVLESYMLYNHSTLEKEQFKK